MNEQELLRIFKNFNGTGYLSILFLLALLYLWCTEKDKRLRWILLYAPAAVLVLFFLPPFKKLLDLLLDSATYYRVLWLLPMTAVTAYAGVKLIREHLRAGAAVLALLLVCSGTCVYANQYVTKAENAYHLPQAVIDICDAIAPGEGGQVMAVFPAELIHYVRQYSSSVLMPYGRDMLVPSWDYAKHPVYEAMETGTVVDVKALVPLLEDYNCHYVIFWEQKELLGEPEENGLTFVMETGEYRVYRTGVPFTTVEWNDSYLYG